jgi:hypothetical protein
MLSTLPSSRGVSMRLSRPVRGLKVKALMNEDQVKKALELQLQRSKVSRSTRTFWSNPGSGRDHPILNDMFMGNIQFKVTIGLVRHSNEAFSRLRSLHERPSSPHGLSPSFTTPLTFLPPSLVPSHPHPLPPRSHTSLPPQEPRSGTGFQPKAKPAASKKVMAAAAADPVKEAAARKADAKAWIERWRKQNKTVVSEQVLKETAQRLMVGSVDETVKTALSRQTKGAAAAPAAPAAKGGDVAAQAAARKKEAAAWIATWRSKYGKKAVKVAAPAAAKGGDVAAEAAARKKEAAAWIASWRSKYAGAKKAAAK